MSKKNMKSKPNPDKCKGCYLCIRSCPKGAISIMDTANEKGYMPVQVDEEKCIGCSICYQVCPDSVFEIR